MPARKRITDEEQIARTLRAARLFVGESDEPLDEEEAAVIEEIKRSHPRPSAAEIKALAQKAAKKR